MLEHEVELEIPFHDVDVMRIAWHGHYVKYLEIARCALLEAIHYNCDEMEATGYVWPVIELNIRYAKPLHFKQRIRVQAKVVEWENRLKIAYTLFDSASGQRLTKAYTVQVAVDTENGEMQFASPHILFDKLGVTV